jgi:hypothetical protein
VAMGGAWPYQERQPINVLKIHNWSAPHVACRYSHAARNPRAHHRPR